MQFERGRCH
jgi:hypothetical protein